MADFDLSALDDVINKLDNLNQDSPDALADTLNYGAELAIDAAEEMISAELNLEHDYIRGKIAISQRATATRFSTTVSAKRRGLLMPRYEAKQVFENGKRAGVSVKVKTKGNRKTMKSAFFIKLKRSKIAGAGAMGLATRHTDNLSLTNSEKKEKKKHGYVVLHGPSVSQALETMSEDIDIDNQSLINFFLNRIKQK